MATAAETITIGPKDHGRRMTLDEFVEAETIGGWLYELARGVVVVTQVPRPDHGWVVRLLARLFDRYDEAHPGVIKYLAGGMECRLRLPGMVSDRHPDQAVYLRRAPEGEGDIWRRWVPDIIVEVVSPRGKRRDYVEKREEYLRAGVFEYWIIDPKARTMLVLNRMADIWEEIHYKEDGVHRTDLLPGLEARLADLLAPGLVSE